jgi:hypothetical protein
VRSWIDRQKMQSGMCRYRRNGNRGNTTIPWIWTSYCGSSISYKTTSKEVIQTHGQWDMSKYGDLIVINQYTLYPPNGPYDECYYRHDSSSTREPSLICCTVCS